MNREEIITMGYFSGTIKKKIVRKSFGIFLLEVIRHLDIHQGMIRRDIFVLFVIDILY